MTSIAETNPKSRLDALRDERDDLNERLQDLLDEAEHHGLTGRMERWADARARAQTLAAHLTIVNEQIAALEFGRGSRGLPKRTQSWAVER